MRRSVLSALVVAAGIVVFGGGCTSVQNTESITVRNPLRVVPERPLDDVPVPVGFTYKKNDSYVFSGNYRVAKLEYRGTPHIEECIEYFKEQAPVSRWSFVRETSADGQGLTFQNEAEEITVQFDRRGGGTKLSIEVKPRST